MKNEKLFIKSLMFATLCVEYLNLYFGSTDYVFLGCGIIFLLWSLLSKEETIEALNDCEMKTSEVKVTNPGGYLADKIYTRVGKRYFEIHGVDGIVFRDVGENCEEHY